MVLDTTKFDIENVQLLDKKNNVITDGNFTKIIYSNSHFTMNGVYFCFHIQLISIKNNIGYFDYSENKYAIDTIIEIETSILNKYSCDKPNEYIKTSVGFHLKNGTIKMNRHYCENTKKCDFVIKISGIWENQNTIGIMCKIYEKYISDNLLNFSI